MAAENVPLSCLLARGDAVAVKRGRLSIVAASGKAIPVRWLAVHERRIIAEAASMAGVMALAYQGYSVGNYGPKRAGGVTLQFHCLVTGQEVFAIFNASTKRARTTAYGESGSPLPVGQFRVGKNSGFYKFWESAGLPHRQRRSDFHDYMGRLAEVVFTGNLANGERLNASTLQPLNIDFTANQPDNFPTSARQLPDTAPTSMPDKKLPQRKQTRGMQGDSATGANRCGNTVIREYGDTGKPVSPDSQSVDEWLADYEDAESEQS